ncbi:choice-of-anchor K domain-containing protein [Horticoccus luteus]|uniref:Choice-of-anchor K domain-containing protein n=1 Tax=Horticoccus luteus TaxID=2862869 RepID=A0A8F9XMR6_9BACT|nr:choice-of-anchor K domain-containing protein [Horticoccus luteus]QYM80334.1 choice-of-anchor K domain-containing protein [Horticoccus luteus]
MNTRLRFILPAAALGLALTCAANAQLMLSGHTTGSFDDLSQANTTVTNAGDGSFAVYKTGIPANGSFQSSIVFNNATFSNVSSGDAIQVGLFTITNGIAKIGSSAHSAVFHLGLDLTSPSAQSLALSDFAFTLNHTPNLPDYTNVPDAYSISFTPPPSTTIDGYKVWFDVVVSPSSFNLGEEASQVTGAVYVHFTPVPEPSTYALCGAALLGGLVIYRRFRSKGRALTA